MNKDNPSVEFFESQFQRQVRDQDFVLNPFETLALDHIEGDVLDLGCGLGNLSLAAARRGHSVVAVDASASAIRHVRERAALEQLPVRAIEADLQSWDLEGSYDSVMCIGLLMFFAKPRALALFDQLQAAVRPGGLIVINVLIEGTTYMRMFDPHRYHLFEPAQLEERFMGWRIIDLRSESRPAPGGTVKRFSTVVAARNQAR